MAARTELNMHMEYKTNHIHVVLDVRRHDYADTDMHAVPLGGL